MATLPTSGGDNGTWGDILNTYLSVDHNAGGFNVFTNTGTGAAARKVSDRLKETFSVQDYGATGDGTTDDTTAIQRAINAAIGKGGGVVYFPAVNSPTYYKITAPLTFTAAGSNNIQVSLVGDAGIDIYGSVIIGDFAGFLISHPDDAGQRLRGIYGLKLQNSHASGKGILIEGSQQAVIDRCYVAAKLVGIQCASNAYNTQIRNTAVVGNGVTAVNSVGIFASQVTISEGSIVGWAEGVRAHNAGFCLENSRLEVNYLAVRLGVDPAGAGSTLGGSVIKANSFERNDTGILIEGIGGCAIIGNFITGTADVDGTGTVDYGLRVTGGDAGLFVAGNTIAGTYNQAAYSIENNYSEGSTVYMANTSNNNGSGVNWAISRPAGKVFIGNVINAQTTKTGSGILSAADHKTIKMNSGSANTLSVRNDSYMNGDGGTPPIGDEYTIIQIGAGQTTLAADNGPGGNTIVIRFPGGKNKLSGQYSVATLLKIGADEWLAYGDLTT